MVDEWVDYKKTGKKIEQNYLPNQHFQCDPKEWCELIAAMHPKVTGYSYELVRSI